MNINQQQTRLLNFLKEHKNDHIGAGVEQLLNNRGVSTGKSVTAKLKNFVRDNAENQVNIQNLLNEVDDLEVAGKTILTRSTEFEADKALGEATAKARAYLRSPARDMILGYFGYSYLEIAAKDNKKDVKRFCEAATALQDAGQNGINFTDEELANPWVLLANRDTETILAVLQRADLLEDFLDEAESWAETNEEEYPSKYINIKYLAHVPDEFKIQENRENFVNSFVESGSKSKSIKAFLAYYAMQHPSLTADSNPLDIEKSVVAMSVNEPTGALAFEFSKFVNATLADKVDFSMMQKWRDILIIKMNEAGGFGYSPSTQGFAEFFEGLPFNDKQHVFSLLVPAEKALIMNDVYGKADAQLKDAKELFPSHHFDLLSKVCIHTLKGLNPIQKKVVFQQLGKEYKETTVEERFEVLRDLGLLDADLFQQVITRVNRMLTVDQSTAEDKEKLEALLKKTGMSDYSRNGLLNGTPHMRPIAVINLETVTETGKNALHVLFEEVVAELGMKKSIFKHFFEGDTEVFFPFLNQYAAQHPGSLVIDTDGKGIFTSVKAIIEADPTYTELSQFYSFIDSTLALEVDADMALLCADDVLYAINAEKLLPSKVAGAERAFEDENEFKAFFKALSIEQKQAFFSHFSIENKAALIKEVVLAFNKKIDNQTRQIYALLTHSFLRFENETYRAKRAATYSANYKSRSPEDQEKIRHTQNLGLNWDELAIELKTQGLMSDETCNELLNLGVVHDARVEKLKLDNLGQKVPAENPYEFLLLCIFEHTYTRLSDTQRNALNALLTNLYNVDLDNISWMAKFDTLRQLRLLDAGLIERVVTRLERTLDSSQRTPEDVRIIRAAFAGSGMVEEEVNAILEKTNMGDVIFTLFENHQNSWAALLAEVIETTAQAGEEVEFREVEEKMQDVGTVGTASVNKNIQIVPDKEVKAPSAEDYLNGENGALILGYFAYADLDDKNSPYIDPFLEAGKMLHDDAESGIKFTAEELANPLVLLENHETGTIVTILQKANLIDAFLERAREWEEMDAIQSAKYINIKGLATELARIPEEFRTGKNNRKFLNPFLQSKKAAMRMFLTRYAMEHPRLSDSLDHSGTTDDWMHATLRSDYTGIETTRFSDFINATLAMKVRGEMISDSASIRQAAKDAGLAEEGFELVDDEAFIEFFDALTLEQKTAIFSHSPADFKADLIIEVYTALDEKIEDQLKRAANFAPGLNTDLIPSLLSSIATQTFNRLTPMQQAFISRMLGEDVPVGIGDGFRLLREFGLVDADLMELMVTQLRMLANSEGREPAATAIIEALLNRATINNEPIEQREISRILGLGEGDLAQFITDLDIAMISTSVPEGAPVIKSVLATLVETVVELSFTEMERENIAQAKKSLMQKIGQIVSRLIVTLIPGSILASSAYALFSSGYAYALFNSIVNPSGVTAHLYATAVENLFKLVAGTLVPVWNSVVGIFSHTALISARNLFPLYSWFPVILAIAAVVSLSLLLLGLRSLYRAFKSTETLANEIGVPMRDLREPGLFRVLLTKLASIPTALFSVFKGLARLYMQHPFIGTGILMLVAGLLAPYTGLFAAAPSMFSAASFLSSLPSLLPSFEELGTAALALTNFVKSYPLMGAGAGIILSLVLAKLVGGLRTLVGSRRAGVVVKDEEILKEDSGSSRSKSTKGKKQKTDKLGGTSKIEVITQELNIEDIDFNSLEKTGGSSIKGGRTEGRIPTKSRQGSINIDNFNGGLQDLFNPELANKMPYAQEAAVQIFYNTYLKPFLSEETVDAIRTVAIGGEIDRNNKDLASLFIDLGMRVDLVDPENPDSDIQLIFRSKDEEYNRLVVTVKADNSAEPKLVNLLEKYKFDTTAFNEELGNLIKFATDEPVAFGNTGHINMQVLYNKYLKPYLTNDTLANLFLNAYRGYQLDIDTNGDIYGRGDTEEAQVKAHILSNELGMKVYQGPNSTLQMVFPARDDSGMEWSMTFGLGSDKDTAYFKSNFKIEENSFVSFDDFGYEAISDESDDDELNTPSVQNVDTNLLNDDQRIARTVAEFRQFASQIREDRTLTVKEKNNRLDDYIVAGELKEGTLSSELQKLMRTVRENIDTLPKGYQPITDADEYPLLCALRGEYIVGKKAYDQTFNFRFKNTDEDESESTPIQVEFGSENNGIVFMEQRFLYIDQISKRA